MHITSLHSYHPVKQSVIEYVICMATYYKKKVSGIFSPNIKTLPYKMKNGMKNNINGQRLYLNDILSH